MSTSTLLHRLHLLEFCIYESLSILAVIHGFSGNYVNDQQRGLEKVMKKELSKSAVEEADEFEPCNEVLLVGRVSAPAVSRELPSGDKVVEFRVVVERSISRSKKREVDTLDIAAWSASARKSALSLKAESWVEVQGAVRRRFWQAPSGLASRWQVEALSITKL